jgi:hypothetical protein
VAVVTGALIVGAAAGAVALGIDVGASLQSANWNRLAYDAGSVLGGAIAGGLTGRAGAEAINDVKSPPWSLRSDAAQHFDPSLGSIGDWLGTGFNPGSAAAANATAGAGAAVTAKPLSGDCD